MSTITIPRPGADEHISYYGTYISQVPDGDLISMLRDQVVDTVKLLQNLSPSQADYAYAPGKWTVKQVIGHIVDAERIFVYRALRIARHDNTNLPGFDENAFVDNANFQNRTLEDLLEELQVVRAATIAFIKNLDPSDFERRGTANNNPISVRALVYIVAGHERHHTKLLRERYLSH